MSTPPLPNTQSTEKPMEKPRPRKPFGEEFREEIGRGFIIGGVVGSALEFPNGGIQAVLRTAPRHSGYCAVLLGVFSAVERGMGAVRRKEEPTWVDISAAAAAACGVTELPNGVRAAGRSALIGGAFGLVLFSGMGKLSQVFKDGQRLKAGTSLP